MERVFGERGGEAFEGAFCGACWCAFSGLTCGRGACSEENERCNRNEMEGKELVADWSQARHLSLANWGGRCCTSTSFPTSGEKMSEMVRESPIIK